MTRQKVCLTFLERDSYPYATEAAAAQTVPKQQDDLNKDKKGLPNVDMARHHIVPVNMIKKAWDKMAGAIYTNDASKVPAYLSGYFSYLHSIADGIPFTPTPPRTEVENLKILLLALVGKTLYHDPTGEAPAGFNLLCDIVCWTPGNVVVGPTPFPGKYEKPREDKSGRVDDPKDRIEQYLQVAVTDEARRAAVNRFKRAAQWIEDGKTPRGDQDFTEFFFVNLRALSIENGVYLPQGVRDDVWDRIPPGEIFLLPAGDHLESHAAQLTREKYNALWCTNQTGRILRQVKGRRVPLPPKVVDSPAPATAELPASTDLDTSITIDGTVIELEVLTDGDYRKLRRGSVTGVRMGPLLHWITDRWAEKLELPDFIENLTLDQLSVVAEAGPGGWETWQFALAVGTELAGVTTDMILYLEYIKGIGFSLAASLALKGKTTGDTGPLLFSGDISKSGSEWELGATGGPLRFTDLAQALNVKTDELPPELQGIIPDLRQVGIRCRFTASGTDMAVTATTDSVQIALATLSG